MSLGYRYDRALDAMSGVEEEAYYAASEERSAVSLLGVVEECTVCGADTNDHSGLCVHCLDWVEREPYGPGYDRVRFGGYDGWQG